MLTEAPAGFRSALHDAVWRGQLAAMPAWKAGLVRLARLALVLARDLAYGQLTLRATGLVYTTLLSLVPLLALSFTVLKAFGVYNQMDPILLNFLAPLGEKSADASKWFIKFIEGLNVKVLGSIGLALLLYTVISLMQKIEESVNFIWHVAQLRSFARRFSGYLSVLLAGPVLVFTAIGISSTLMAAAPLQPILAIAPIATAVHYLGRAISLGLVIGVFVFAYRFAPNAKVRLRAALIGGIAAGLLWEGARWAFADFVRLSTQYAAIYSGFAIFLLFLIWLYLNWLILLLGASIAFYTQHPEYLSPQAGEPRLSNRMRERVALMLMYLVAKNYRDGGPAYTLSRLARRLEVPGPALQAVLAALERDGLLVRTGAEPPAYVPSRDPGSIALTDLLRSVRAAGEDYYLGPDAVPVPAEIESFLASASAALEHQAGSLTLRQLLPPAPASN
jgi:membrane protein